MPFAIAVWNAGGLVLTFTLDLKSAPSRHSPSLDRSPDRPVVRGLHIDAFRHHADFAGHTGRREKPVPTDLMPGEQIDYAGHRCGNPNLYVKTHNCLFPQRNSTP